jgi:hypothetical protein
VRIQVALILGLLIGAAWLPRRAVADEGAEPEPGSSARPENGYWSVGKPRWFFSAKPEAGIVFVKPYVSLGYGIPHWIWAGLDVNTIVTTEMFQAYAGIRAASPIFDLAFGFRDTWSFSKHFVEPAARYSRYSVFEGPGAIARYWAWEAEAVAVAPLPHSALLADLIMVGLLDVPKGQAVYDESYRGIVTDSMYFTLRVAAVARLLRENALKIGVLSEFLFGTGRDQGVVRIGPAGSMQLTDHLDINAVGTLTVSSPDSLGLKLGAYAMAGVRYRWATGEDRPAFPWAEPVIPW